MNDDSTGADSPATAGTPAPLTIADVSTAVDLALRVGAVKLANGGSASEVSQAMRSVARAAGLVYFEVDVTYTGLTITSHDAPGHHAHSKMRMVNDRSVNLTTLAAVDECVAQLRAGTITRIQAWQEVVRATNTEPERAYWRRVCSWGALGAAVALMIGGGWLVTVVAFLTACCIALVSDKFAKHDLPMFYSQVVGGVLASVVAALLKWADLVANPSLVITAGIIMLLAGGSLMGSLADALSGYYVTGNARLLESTLATAGIFVGVSAGLSLAASLTDGAGFSPGTVQDVRWFAFMAGAAVTGASFYYASHGPVRIVPVAAGLAALGAVVYRFCGSLEIDATWSTAFAAVVVGWVGTLVASRLGLPFMAIRAAALIPLLPGLAIFRGLALLPTLPSYGLVQLFGAAGIALSLAAGALLGEYIATPMTKWRGFHVRKY